MKKSRLLGAMCAFTLSVLITTTQAAIVVPTGLNPGDAYHVIFITSTTTQATSTDIADYDNFVQGVALDAVIGSNIGVSWRALGSTSTVSAIDHLSPLFTDMDAPIYNQNGDLIATNFSDLWDDSLSNPIKYDETGSLTAVEAWTGSFADGTPWGNGTTLDWSRLGDTLAVYGNSWLSDAGWTNQGGDPTTSLNSLYAVSGQLTAPVPIPAAVWLFGSGLLGLIGIARRKKPA